MTGKLFLIPTPIGTDNLAWVLPPAVQQCAAEISHYIVEHPKTARQFLKQLNSQHALQAISMQILDEHTPEKDLPKLLDPLIAGQHVGLIAEAGCPGIADPGAALIRLAHRQNITVVPFVGPSSIVVALMASGLNGQCFIFHGYLPIENTARTSKIITMEKDSIRLQQTQIFIETPYRNQKLLEQLVSACQIQTDLCIASALMSGNESIITRSIQQWRSAMPTIEKVPAIYLLQGRP